MKKIADSLAIGGNPITSNELIMHLLTGLDENYESLVTNILTRFEKEKLTAEEVYSMMLSHETRLEMSKEKSHNEPLHDMTTNFTQKGQGYNRYGYNQKNVGAGNFGVYDNNQNMSTGPGKDVVCQIYYIPGHGAYKCKHRFNQGFIPRNKGFGGFRLRTGGQNYRGFPGNNQNYFGRGSGYNSSGFGSGFRPNFPRQAGPTGPFFGYVAYQNPGFMNSQGAFDFPSANGDYNGVPTANMYAGNYGIPHNVPPFAQLANYSSVADPAWYLDSGATNHIAQDAGILSKYSTYHGLEKLHVGNGMGLPIHNVGFVTVKTLTTTPIYLNHILHVLTITKNLISISKLLADNNVFIEFYNHICFVKDKNSRITLLKGIARGGLYQVSSLNAVCDNSSSMFPVSTSSESVFNSISTLPAAPVSMFTQLSSFDTKFHPCMLVNNPQINKNVPMAHFASYNKPIDYSLLHKRMGHPTTHALKQIMKCLHSNFILPKDLKSQFCDVCQLGKSHMQHFPSIETSTTLPLELLHADLWGPAPITSSQGYTYYLSILDDYTRYTWIFPLTAKSKTLSTFIEFKNMIENCLNLKIKCLQTYWGGEFRPFVSYLSDQEPLTVSAALNDPKWLQAMREEYQALVNNQTWTLVQPIYPVKVVGNKWVFRIKHNADGSISRYKARFVVKGFHQTQGIDYNETFSPVVKASTVKLVLSLRVQGHLLLVLVYVDDIIVTGSDSAQIQQVFTNQQTTFALKDLGELHFFLGIQVTKTDTGLYLSQSKYIADLLNKVKMKGCTPCSTPMAANVPFTKTDSEPFPDATLYRSTIGALQYATLTRPEITFPVNKLNQFVAAPTINHWQACKRILRYLKGTMHMGLQYSHQGPLNIDCFSDADWAADRDDRKSIAGYCVYFGPNMIS
ncbi:reverse transcriptase Ty1/copia-type domain-containing protein [Citrus sinensis]|uniref:Reverse transcriptase Ty1/copia-type domain-containing protein n=1 Tax=Citrus sinensis TaxID=2711 RepID=A0ACB8KAK4_CITSI|nr:reverse transcriptase Ty1/copia-type domain-containing protein [Citrus sinensis]